MRERHYRCAPRKRMRVTTCLASGGLGPYFLYAIQKCCWVSKPTSPSGHLNSSARLESHIELRHEPRLTPPARSALLSCISRHKLCNLPIRLRGFIFKIRSQNCDVLSQRHFVQLSANQEFSLARVRAL